MNFTKVFIFPEALGLSLDMNMESMEVTELLGQVDVTWADEEHLSVYLTNDCEYKGKRLQTNSDVPGRLLSEESETSIVT